MRRLRRVFRRLLRHRVHGWLPVASTAWCVGCGCRMDDPTAPQLCTPSARRRYRQALDLRPVATLGARVQTSTLVTGYIASGFLANVLTARYGPWAAPAVALVLIGFDLTARDLLHARWRGRGLAWRMAVLVATGSLLAGLVPGTPRIALASFLAFASSGLVDTWVYAHLWHRGAARRILVSNFASAVVDSWVFLGIAFGITGWPFVLQVAVKVLGGALWLWFLGREKAGPRAPRLGSVR